MAVCNCEGIIPGTVRQAMGRQQKGTVISIICRDGYTEHISPSQNTRCPAPQFPMENAPAPPWYFPMFPTQSEDSAGTELPGSYSHGPLILPGLSWLCICLLTRSKSLLQNNPSICVSVYHLHALGILKVGLQVYPFPCKTTST